MGSKTRIGNGLLTAALFRTDTDDEIVVGCQLWRTYQLQNAGKNPSSGGGSFSISSLLKLEAEMVWTYLIATYRTNVCGDDNCNGNRMPGIARNMGFAFVWLAA